MRSRRCSARGAAGTEPNLGPRGARTSNNTRRLIAFAFFFFFFLFLLLLLLLVSLLFLFFLCPCCVCRAIARPLQRPSLCRQTLSTGYVGMRRCQVFFSNTHTHTPTHTHTHALPPPPPPSSPFLPYCVLRRCSSRSRSRSSGSWSPLHSTSARLPTCASRHLSSQANLSRSPLARSVVVTHKQTYARTHQSKAAGGGEAAATGVMCWWLL